MKSGLTALTVTMTTGSNTYKDHPTAQILPMVTQTQLHVTQFCSAHLPKSRPCTPTTQLPINDKHMLTRPPLPLLPPPPPPPYSPLLSIIAPSNNYSVVLSPHRRCAKLLLTTTGLSMTVMEISAT